tara:strand:- start:191 stop:421 length:231 start_codon:yes stop_codon:yes gene_type:complete
MNSIKQFIANISNTNLSINNILKTYRVSNINKSVLGRWNSVIAKPQIEDNKYIDWGNIDNCCCSHNFKVKKHNRQK